MRVIGGDTDSVFIDLNEQNLLKLLKKSKVLESEINDSFDDFVNEFGLKNHFFSIKLEKVCKSILFVPKRGTGTAKKRYAYIPFWTEGKTSSDIVYSGFQNKRCDSSKLAKNFQKFVIKQILEEKCSTVIPLTKMIRIGIENGNFKDEIIGIPGGYNRVLKEYKSIPISVKSAENSNKLYNTNYQRGDRFLWLYVNNKEKTVAFDKKLPVGVKINVQETVRRTLTGPLENIFKAICLDYYKYFPKKQIQKNTLKTYMVKK